MSDDRVNDYLDGLLPREALSLEEAQRADVLEAAAREAAAALRAAPAPDLTARVMARLPLTAPATAGAAPAPAPAPAAAPAAAAAASSPDGQGLLQRLVGWLWRPLDVAIRPAYALGGAMAIVAAALLLPGPGGAPLVEGEAGDARMYVQFRIEVPDASEVAVAGTFTGWQPDYELTEISPGVWSAMVPLAPGVHDYTFVIDGERMVVDPYAPRVADSFGGSNSRLFLPAPNGSA